MSRRRHGGACSIAGIQTGVWRIQLRSAINFYSIVRNLDFSFDYGFNCQMQETSPK